MINQILSLSKSLISLPSTAGNKKALKEVLEVAEKELKNFTIERFEKDGIPSILVYQQKRRPEKFRVILNAHLDVVSAKDEQYKPYEKDGKLYGRGSIDMKAAAAVEILVFKELARKINYPMALQLVTDEEVGGFKGTLYQLEKGVKADFVIAGEPTDFGINNKAKGILWLKIKTKGVSSHGAYPWQGKNALFLANEILNKIYKNYPIPKKEAWQTTFNLARIETPNQTFNKVPDEAIISFDIRYIPEEFKGNSFEKGKEIFLKKIKKIIGNLGQVEIVLFEPPQFTDEKNHYVKILAQTTQKITGKKAKIIVKHGGSDIRHFNRFGAEGVTFGPIGAGLHSDNEYVEIESLEKYYLILENFLKEI
ncbi:MAG: M20 family metallopeptidase [Microgenomates group bacterium]